MTDTGLGSPDCGPPELSAVGVVIPVRNDAADLAATVGAVLAEFDELGERAHRVVLCVGPSTDGTESVATELAAADPRVVVVDNPDGGIPQALNLGLEHTEAAVLARVDARALIGPGYLQRALDTLISLADSGAAGVGAVQRPVGRTDTEIAIAAAMASKLGSGAPAYRVGGGAPRPVDTAWMGVYRRDALSQVGGWDERFARNEDAELNARLAAAGHEIWLDPELVADYRPRSTLVALARQYWDYGWWRAKMLQRHPRSLAARQLAGPAIVVGIVTLGVLALSWNPWTWLGVAAYPLTIVLAAPARGLHWGQRAKCRSALAIMHLSWGAGFVASVLAGCVRLPTINRSGSPQAPRGV